MEFDEWYERNYDELMIMWAERGCDREPDADWGEFTEYEFDIHCGKDLS